MKLFPEHENILIGSFMEHWIEIATVDSFTKTPFSGNPAAVCIFKHGETITEKQMQTIAKEMCLSETAFAMQSEKLPHEFHLRWFTPTIEVPLCGHATLATAHYIFESHSDLLNSATEIHFTTNVSGVLKVKKSLDGGLQMDFPRASPEKVNLDFQVLQELANLMKFDVSTVEEVYACGTTRKLLIAVNSRDVLPKLDPDMQSIVKINFGLKQTIKGVMITTKGDDEYDFYTRYFAPWVGIPEDPVTGSAHTVLAVYWGSRLNKTRLRGFQASERGGSMYVDLVENSRVILEGNATTVMRGNLLIPKK